MSKDFIKFNYDGLDYFHYSTNSIYSNHVTVRCINDSPDATLISYYDKNGKLIYEYEYKDTYYVYNSERSKMKLELISSEILKFVPTIEEKIEEHILNNYDKYDFKEKGSYVYQIIQEKAYEFIHESIKEAKEEYDIPDEDKIIEIIMEEIDFDSLYELIEDTLHAPITIEEKLIDIGMSYKDFL